MQKGRVYTVTDVATRFRGVTLVLLLEFCLEVSWRRLRGLPWLLKHDFDCRPATVHPYHTRTWKPVEILIEPHSPLHALAFSRRPATIRNPPPPPTATGLRMHAYALGVPDRHQPGIGTETLFYVHGSTGKTMPRFLPALPRLDPAPTTEATQSRRTRIATPPTSRFQGFSPLTCAS